MPVLRASHRDPALLTKRLILARGFDVSTSMEQPDYGRSRRARDGGTLLSGRFTPANTRGNEAIQIAVKDV